jgi:hypothetical protein
MSCISAPPSQTDIQLIAPKSTEAIYIIARKAKYFKKGRRNSMDETTEFIMLLHRHPEAIPQLMEIVRAEKGAAAPAGESEGDR